jgi:hypothetical protein
LEVEGRNKELGNLELGICELGYNDNWKPATGLYATPIQVASFATGNR